MLRQSLIEAIDENDVLRQRVIDLEAILGALKQ